MGKIWIYLQVTIDYVSLVHMLEAEDYFSGIEFAFVFAEGAALTKMII